MSRGTAIITVILIELLFFGGIYYKTAHIWGSDKTSVFESAVINEAEELDCTQCHYIKSTKEFHLPQNILRIEEENNLQRKICVDCHSLPGLPNASVGENGVFTVPAKLIHAIHEKKIESGELICDTCHMRDGQLYTPKADVSAGQVIVCQNCKAHPEEGNYITIHFEIGKKKCIICHEGMHTD